MDEGNFFDSFEGTDQEQSNILDSMAPTASPDRTPVATLRNKAAAIAMLKGGDSVQTYRDVIQQAESGKPLNQIDQAKSLAAGAMEMDTQGIMSVLSDPTIDIETKKASIARVKAPSLLRQPSGLVLSQALAADSGDETEQAEAARMSIVGEMEEALRSRIVQQDMITRFMASRNPDYNKALSEAIVGEMYPGFLSEMSARMEDKDSLWEKTKAAFAPGTSMKKEQQQMIELPPREATAKLLQVIDKLKNLDGFLIDEEDTYNKLQYLQNYADGNVMSTAEEWLMNADPYLSILGFAASKTVSGKIALRLKNQKEALEDAKKVITSVDTARETKAPVAPSKAPPGAPVSKVSVPDRATAAKAKQIAKLEEEKAGLLGDVNDAGRRDVTNIKAELAALTKPDTNPKDLAATLKKGNPRLSAKDARVEAAKRVDEEMNDYLAKRSRLEGMLETNKASASTTQRIADLEKEIASLSKGMPKYAGSVENKVLSVIKSIEWNQTARMDLPGAVANVIGSANPTMARGMFAAVLKATDDTAARALYGTTKEEAVVANLAPQIVAPNGSVTTKVPQIDRDVIREAVTGGEGLEFKGKELASAFKFAKERFNNGPGLVANEAMGGIRTSENGDVVSFDAVFGSPEGGFPTVKDAMEQTKYALQKFGVTDDQIEVLVSDGVTHRPVDVASIGDKPGNYYVRVKTDYQVNMHDVGSIDWVDTKWNALDALPGTLWADSGQASRLVMDAASMYHPVYSGAAVRAEDVGSKVTAALIEEAKEFTDKMDKLPKHRQSAINEYLQAQNLAGKADDPLHLAANFHQDEISAIDSFRKFWDTHFYLENRSVAIGARNEGWEILDTPTTFQVGKKMHENFKGSVAKAYDPASGTVVRLSQQEADALYAGNGFYAKLRRPQTFSGETVEHMIVRNTPQEYLRRINDNDQLLNKRPGYYQLNYKAAKFIDVVTRDAKGGILTRKTVAVAGDTGEANAWTKRQSLQPGEEWDVRNDTKAMRTGSDEWFDVNQAGGRMATRHRGQPLDVGSGLNHVGTSDYIVNPVDSAVRAARSVGQHVAMNSVLANMKERFKNQYWKLLPDDGMGGKKFPSAFAELGAKGDRSSDLTDARTVFGYIKYLEDGHINGMDNVVKMVMGKASDMAAAKGFYKTEKALNKASEVSAASALKAAVFKTTIAAHPVRQALIQMHQSVRLASYLATVNPVSTLKAYTNTTGHIMGMARDLAKGVPNAFNKFVDDSGMLDAVTQHNLIRSVTENYMDHSSKVLRKLATPLSVAQKVGFVAGEQASAIAHLAAVYEKYISQGLNLADKRVRAKAYSEARAIMGDMNKAGDMPYNQNSASFAMQFMQVPHKMLLQITNRRIPAKERAKLFAGDLLFWGAPTWAVQNAFTEEVVPDRELRLKLIEGGESILINRMFQELFSSEYKIDFSSFAPNDMSGWFAFFDTMLGKGPDDVLLNSPSGRLFGANGRMQHAMHMTGRYFKPFFDDDATPVEFMTMATEVAKIFSGFNDYQKAKLIKEFGERRDASGKLVETGVPQYAAWFQFFGLGGQDTKWMYETLKTASKIKANNKDDLRKVYNETLKAYSAMSGRGPEDGRTFTAYTGALLSMHKDDPDAMRQIMDWARMDALDPNVRLYGVLARGAGIPDTGELRHMVETAPGLTPEQKDLLIKNLQSFRNVEEE